MLRTEELHARVPRQRDDRAEGDALRAIARHLADSPDTALHDIVHAALRICRAGSAGVSTDASEWSWEIVAGAWAPYAGATVPQRCSFSGVTVDRHAAQLFVQPQKHFTHLTSRTPPSVELLAVPFFHDRGGTGTFWIVSHHAARLFDTEDVRSLEILAGLAAAASGLRAALRDRVQESRSLREINEQLVLSAIHLHELTDEAQRAETSVRDSRRQLQLELSATQQLQEISTKLIAEGDDRLLYEQILDAAVTIMRSQFASIQLLDDEQGTSGALRLLAHRGFDPEAARFWEWVRPNSKGTCASVLGTCQRHIVSDVQQCAFMAGSEDLQTFLRLGIRAVQSTPLVSRSGRLLGMLSTHWKNPHQPADFDLHLLDVLARQASDFVERMQVQHALRESNRQFQALAEAIPVMVWTADASGWIDWYNSLWYEYTGQTVSESIGWGWQATQHPDDFQRVMEAWPRAIARGEPLEMEFRLRRRDGVFRHFLSRIRPYRNERGEIVRWYGSNFDIQEQKTAFEQSQRIARTLQGRFLPRALPRTEKIRFDATYTAAEKDVLVGGDWFEATQLPDGRYLITVGDVTGHGLDASVIADRLRQAVVDFAFTNEDPAAILSGVNRMLRFQTPDVYATAVVALVDRDCTGLTYASAGHPAPLIATTSTVPARALQHGGLPLGVADDVESISRYVVVPPGAVVAFYTDGLIEFARNIEAAEMALQYAVAQAVGETDLTSGPAEIIKAKVLRGQRAPDDIALLIAHFAQSTMMSERDDPKRFTKVWRFHSSDARTAHTSRHELMEFMRGFSSDEGALFTAELILGEILANSVAHAPGLIEVTIDWTGARPVVSVVDTGPGMRNQRVGLPEDVMAESGRGLFLVNALGEAGSLSLMQADGIAIRVVLPLTRRLPPEPAAAAP